MLDLIKLERQCLAKIAAIEVVRESLGMATVSLSDIIERLEHVEHDAQHGLDFGLALQYSIKLFQKFDIRVIKPKK